MCGCHTKDEARKRARRSLECWPGTPEALDSSQHWGPGHVKSTVLNGRGKGGLEKLGLRVVGAGRVTGEMHFRTQTVVHMDKKNLKEEPPKLCKCDIFRVCDTLE